MQRPEQPESVGKESPSRGVELAALLARVEAAAGRLDDKTLGRILCAVHGVSVVSTSTHCGDDGSDELCVVGRMGEVWSGYRSLAPDVSIDAALALVERVRPGHDCSVVKLTPAPCEAYIWPRGSVCKGEKNAKAPTAPLALLAALLRSLTADDRSLGDGSMRPDEAQRMNPNQEPLKP